MQIQQIFVNVILQLPTKQPLPTTTETESSFGSFGRSLLGAGSIFSGAILWPDLSII